METPSADRSLARRLVEWTIRRRAVLFAVVLLLAVPAGVRTVQLYLHLKTSIEELLPREAPSVIAVDEARTRLPGLQYLGVVVDTGTAENMPAAENMLDDLAERVRQYPPELVRRVRLGSQEEKDFLTKHAVLYMDLEDLKTIRERVTARRDYEVQKQSGVLLDESEQAPSVDFSDIQKKYEARSSGLNRFPNGRFSNTELKTTLLLIEVGEFQSGHSRASELFHHVQRDLEELGGPDHYAPGMKVGYSGDVAINVEETEALAEDLSISTVLVFASVMLVIVLYYRWWRALFLLLPPLVVGTLFTFALASLPPFRIDALNSNTAFLGSIIIGNGINFGIVLVARYVEERRNGLSNHDAMIEAIHGSRAGTLAAALAAGVAYASLGVTEFRGFRQFGCIGGIGMVMSWLCAFVLIPPLASWFDRKPEHAPEAKKHGFSVMRPVTWVIDRAPRVLAVVFVGALALSVSELRKFGDDSIEYDLSKLRRADTWKNGEGLWGRKMDALLGTYLTPMVILADDQAQAEAIARKLRAECQEQPLVDLIASVHTLDDAVPAQQDEKLAELAAVKKLFTPRLRKLIPEDKRAQAESILDADDVRPITADDLPPTFVSGLRERDGSTGKTVLIFPKPSRQLWVGQPIVTMVKHLRDAAAGAAPNQKPARVAGSLELSADIFESLRRDGPRSTFLAFGGVTLVVLLLFRFSRITALVLGALLFGVALMAGVQIVTGIKLNFSNFIAYPITFGIGVDYSVNVMSRHAQEGRRDILAVVRTTGGAVALCSLTTIIGYSSLLLAQNRALYLFGLLAVIGEATCLSVALIAVPSLILSFRKK